MSTIIMNIAPVNNNYKQQNARQAKKETNNSNN